MRWLLVVAFLASLGACDARNGTYLVVEGNAELTFDRVEFYFGRDVDAAMPTSPGHPTPVAPDAARLATRLYAKTDDQSLTAPVTSLNYYLIDDVDNRKLGDVVIAIAYRDDQPVGIGELADFEITRDDAVYLYNLPLVPYATQEVEVWGRPTPDCVRWTRPTDNGGVFTVAVVRGADLDCDAFRDAGVDCDPIRYCDGTGRNDCAGNAPCIVDEPACQLGTCVNADGAAPRACTLTTCLAEDVCAKCDVSAPTTELLECVVFEGPHTDQQITVHPGGELCVEPYTVHIVLPDAVSCTNPKLEHAAEFGTTSPDFTYAVSQSGTNCAVTITPKIPGTPFTRIAHILISIENPLSNPVDPLDLPRVAFDVSLGPGIGPCDSSETITAQTTVGTCP